MTNLQKEQLQKMVTYQSLVKARLSAPLPKKHLHREKSFKNFLNNELAAVTAKINEFKLSLQAPGAK